MKEDLKKISRDLWEATTVSIFTLLAAPAFAFAYLVSGLEDLVSRNEKQ